MPIDKSKIRIIKKRKHGELNSQIAFYNLCCYKKLGKYIFGIEHGGKRDPVTGSLLKQRGVKKGLADFLCIYPLKKYRGTWIELKYDKNTQTEAQKEFEELVTQLGYKYILSYSAVDALNELLLIIKEDEAKND
jgi:hypothetical protein